MTLPARRRITFVTAQLRGYDRVGGAGTATTFVAIALARAGHDVEVLYGGFGRGAPDPDWAHLFRDAGVSVRRLPPPRANVEPPRFARLRAVEQALRDHVADVVVSHEYSAPTYNALRLRQLGLAFDDVLFVTFCHGTRRWVKEVNRNARVAADVLAESLLERAAVELADVVVSPSGFMLDWMRSQGWRLPERTRVIPYLTRSAVTGEAPAPRVDGRTPTAVERIAFFGRLLEIKGVRPFVAGLNRVRPELLTGLELEFVGASSNEWNPERVQRALSDEVKDALRGISFASDLDQHEALARVGQPGTLAIMPSFADNSPNTVYECLELGIPFLATSVGGTPELVAPTEHARVLFEPTSAGVATALERALTSDDALRPVQAAFEAADSLRQWADVVATIPAVIPRRRDHASVDVNDAPWVVLGDDAGPELVEALVTAQAASGADVVTCALAIDGADGPCEHFFAGDPGGLGVLANGYGTVALIRRELLEDGAAERAADGDRAWPLLAHLRAQGAEIVSIPLPLAPRPRPPGDLAHTPEDALRVVETFERHLPRAARSLARLAAGLAADELRSQSSR